VTVRDAYALKPYEHEFLRVTEICGELCGREFYNFNFSVRFVLFCFLSMLFIGVVSF
jgi:hypothetical protein